MGRLPVNTSCIKVGVIDDHIIFTSSIAEWLNTKDGIQVILEAESGEELLRLLKTINILPDILLMDVEMKGMNGIETTRQVIAAYPLIKVIALTSSADELTIIQMIRAGCCAYLQKDVHPLELEKAIREVYEHGNYHADVYNRNASVLRKYEENEMQVSFSDNEKRFLQLTCQGLSQMEIAKIMFLSPAGVDYHRATLFEKLNVNNRVTMVLAALDRRLISRDSLKKL